MVQTMLYGKRYFPYYTHVIRKYPIITLPVLYFHRLT